MATSLKNRVALLEIAKVKVDVRSMTDDELDARIRTLTAGSADFYDAVLSRIQRYPSALPIVADNYDAEGWKHEID